MANVTPEEVIAALQKLKGEYEELEGTELPTTLKEAVNQRWEVITGSLEIAAFTLYPFAQQEIDSRRAIPLRVVLRMMSDLEEQLIREQVLKPSTIAESALWSGTLGMKKVLFDAAIDLWNVAKGFLNAPSKKDIVRVLVSVVMSRYIRTLDIIAIPELMKSLARGLRMKNDTTHKLRKACLPQRQGPRYRRRKESRR